MFKRCLITRTLSIFIACLFIIGCSKPSLVLVPEKNLPSWYLSPPANTKDVLLGIGSGENIEQATQEALADLTARLGINIESSLEIETKTTHYTYSQDSASSLKSSVDNLHISNYEVVHAEQITYRQFIVMVQSNRQQFINDLKRQLDTNLTSSKNALKQAEKENALKRYLVAKDVAAAALALEPSVRVLSSLSSDFNHKYYQNEILQLKNSQVQARRKVNFIIKPDRQSKQAVAPINNALTQQGFSVNNNKISDGVLLIYLQSKTTRSRSLDFQVAEVDLQIKVLDQQGKLVGSNTVNMKGFATRGFALAEAAAMNELASEIEAQGIQQILGMSF